MSNDVRDPLVRDPWSVGGDDESSAGTFDQSWFADALREGGFLVADAPVADGSPAVAITTDTVTPSVVPGPDPVAPPVVPGPDPVAPAVVPGPDPVAPPGVPGPDTPPKPVVEAAVVPDPAPVAPAPEAPVVADTAPETTYVAEPRATTPPAEPRATTPPVVTSPPDIDLHPDADGGTPMGTATASPRRMPPPVWPRMTPPPSQVSTTVDRASVIDMAPGALTRVAVPPTTLAAGLPPTPQHPLAALIGARRERLAAPATTEVALAASIATEAAGPRDTAGVISQGVPEHEVVEAATPTDAPDRRGLEPASDAHGSRAVDGASPDASRVQPPGSPVDQPAAEDELIWLAPIDGPAETTAFGTADDETSDHAAWATASLVEDRPTEVAGATGWPPSVADDEPVAPAWPTPAEDASAWIMMPPATTEDVSPVVDGIPPTLEPAVPADTALDGQPSPGAIVPVAAVPVTELDAASAEADAVQAAIAETTDLGFDGGGAERVPADVEQEAQDATAARLAALGIAAPIVTGPSAPGPLEPRPPLTGSAEPEASEGELWALVGSPSGTDKAPTAARASRATTVVLTALVALVIVVLVIGFLVLLGQLL